MQKLSSLLAPALLILLLGGGVASEALGQNVTTLIARHPQLKDYIVVHPSGDIYVSNQRDRVVRVAAGERFVRGTPVASGLMFVTGLALSSDGTLYVSDSGTREVLRVTPQGDLEVFASGLSQDGGLGPVGLAFDSQDNLYATVYGGSIRRITPDGTVSLLTDDENLTSPSGLAIDEAGNLYASNFVSGKIVRVTPSGEASLLATIDSELGYIAYAQGALYATGFDTHKIYRITLDGEVSVLAGSGEQGREDGVGELATFTVPNGITPTLDGTGLYVTSGDTTGSLRLITDLPPLPTAAEDAPGVAGYALTASYPNPFARSTTLSFSLPTHDAVTLTLYDVLGRRIRALAEGFYAAGTHTVRVEAGALPAGLYVYTLRTGRGFVASGRMVHQGR